MAEKRERERDQDPAAANLDDVRYRARHPSGHRTCAFPECGLHSSETNRRFVCWTGASMSG